MSPIKHLLRTRKLFFALPNVFYGGRIIMYHITKLSVSCNVRNSHILMLQTNMNQVQCDLSFSFLGKCILLYPYIYLVLAFNNYWLSSFFRKQKMDLYITTPEKLIIFCRGCMFQFAVSNFFRYIRQKKKTDFKIKCQGIVFLYIYICTNKT